MFYLLYIKLLHYSPADLCSSPSDYPMSSVFLLALSHSVLYWLFLQLLSYPYPFSVNLATVLKKSKTCFPAPDLERLIPLKALRIRYNAHFTLKKFLSQNWIKQKGNADFSMHKKYKNIQGTIIILIILRK